ncbi:MAG: hypothetical protein IPG01_12590 [Chitinophagaceae bacterium]|nr:hypothetical protein [Chitinophagaceae bacterium]
MPEVVVKYKTSKTLRALKDLAKYFDYVISSPAKDQDIGLIINGVPVIAADSTIDTSELEILFSEKRVDANAIRKQSWQRRK